MVVDDVKPVRLLEAVSDMETFPDLCVQCGVFGVGPRADGLQFGGRLGIGCGKQGDIDSLPDEAFSQAAHDLFPWAIVPGGHAPGDGGKHCDTKRVTHGWCQRQSMGLA